MYIVYLFIFNQGVPLTAVDIKLFDDDFNKFEPHEACWDIKKRGASGETILHLCLVGDSEIHLSIANILLEMYPKMALDFYEGDEYYGKTPHTSRRLIYVRFVMGIDITVTRIYFVNYEFST